MKPITIATFAVVVLACSLPAGLAAQASSPAPAPIPAKAGVAVGALKAGPVTVTLAHAYASGPIDSAGDLLYMVVLTDRPIAESAIASETKRGGQQLLQSGKLQGLALLVDSTGFIRNIVPYVGELRGNRMAWSRPAFLR